MSVEPVVYVVDADPSICQSLHKQIRAWGWNCQMFSSAEAFIEQLDESRPGCLISELRLADMDGLALLGVLASRQSSLPVVILTSFAEVKVVVQAMQQGAVTVLEKPHDHDDLRAAIQRALEINAQSRQRRQRRWELLHRLERLSPKERQVMDLLIDGKLNKDIATQLRVGLRTVERRRHNILEKMQVGSLPELSRLAAELQSGDNA